MGLGVWQLELGRAGNKAGLSCWGCGGQPGMGGALQSGPEMLGWGRPGTGSVARDVGGRMGGLFCQGRGARVGAGPWGLFWGWGRGEDQRWGGWGRGFGGALPPHSPLRSLVGRGTALGHPQPRSPLHARGRQDSMPQRALHPLSRDLELLSPGRRRRRKSSVVRGGGVLPGWKFAAVAACAGAAGSCSPRGAGRGLGCPACPARSPRSLPRARGGGGGGL